MEGWRERECHAEVVLSASYNGVSLSLGSRAKITGGIARAASYLSSPLHLGLLLVLVKKQQL